MTKFCVQCGAQVNDTARFCNKCGTSVQPAAQTTSPNAAPYTAPTANYQMPPNYQQQYQQPGQPGQAEQSGYGQMPYQQPYRPPFQPTTAGEMKPSIAGALCYPLSFVTGILFLVLTPYNRDRFVRFHAFQSIFLFAVYLALGIAIGILSNFMPWPLDRMLSSVPRLLWLGGTAWMMYQAYKGERFKLPVIGDLAETQANKV
ncbi:MAG: zinc-ribbon domain-containing protein [Blastocatellia bacterium]